MALFEITSSSVTPGVVRPGDILDIEARVKSNVSIQTPATAVIDIVGGPTSEFNFDPIRPGEERFISDRYRWENLPVKSNLEVFVVIASPALGDETIPVTIATVGVTKQPAAEDIELRDCSVPSRVESGETILGPEVTTFNATSESADIVLRTFFDGTEIDEFRHNSVAEPGLNTVSSIGADNIQHSELVQRVGNGEKNVEVELEVLDRPRGENVPPGGIFGLSRL